MVEPGDAKWYAVAVRARKERAAAFDLTRRGFKVFLPTRVERRMWSDRVKTVRFPLFPGYLFVHTVMSPRCRVELLKTRHAIELLGRLPGDGRIAQCIPGEQIASLKNLIASGHFLEPVERLVEGTLVRVCSGALKGATGIVQQVDGGRQRFVVQIEFLGRGVSVALAGTELVEAY